MLWPPTMPGIKGGFGLYGFLNELRSRVLANLILPVYLSYMTKSPKTIYSVYTIDEMAPTFRSRLNIHHNAHLLRLGVSFRSDGKGVYNK